MRTKSCFPGSGYRLVVTGLCLLACVSSYAQDSSKVKAIEQVVVTGQYSPNNPEKAVQRIRIIDRKKIDLMNAQNLGDVLTNELNVRLSEDNILGSSMSIGGISGRNVKIMIDGIPIIGKLDGNIDLDQVNLNNIERIEIIDGPMSVNYGTDALAGTVNLITKKTQYHSLEGGLTTYYESIGRYNTTARAGFRKGKHYVSLNAGRNFFDGWNQGEEISFDYSPRPADSTRFFSSRPKEQYFSTLQYVYTFGKTRINYKGDLFKEKITNRGYPRLPYLEEAYDEFYHTRRFDNAVFINSELRNNGKIDVLVSYNDYKRIKNSYSNDLVTLNSKLTEGSGDQDTSRFEQFNSRGTYSGAPSEQFAYQAGYDVNMQNGTGIRIKNGRQFIGDYAGYISVEYKPWEELTIRPGVRYAYNTSYKAPLIPSLNIRYKVTDQLTARVSYGKGFRAPDVKELYFYFYDANHDVKGNEHLKAEYSDNVNASFCYTKAYDKWYYKAEVSGFYNDISNRIILAPTFVGNEYTYINVGIYKTRGIQANYEINAGNFQLGAGGIYIGLYNEEYESDNTIDKFSYSVDIRGSMSYSWKKQGLTAAIFYKFTGRQRGFGVDTGNKVVPTFVGQFNTGDVTLAKKLFKKRVNLSIGSKNIFAVSRVNSYMVNSEGEAHSASGNSTQIANGRLYFIRFDINFISDEKGK
jgi:outer membrane receptor for ferrienterochelin and colicins